MLEKPTKEQIFSKIQNNLNWMKNNTLFITLHGSHCYGLASETSDIDIRGITCPPKNYFFGFNDSFDQLVTSEPYDMQIFNIVKFFNLAKDGNPNALEILFTETEDHIFVSDIGKKLLDNKDKFLTRNIRERYIGYARSQMHRMKNHKRWIDKPVTPPPTREQFGLTKELSIPKEQLLTVQALFSKKIDEWNCDFEPFSDPQKVYLQNKVSNVLSEMNILSNDKWMLAARSYGISENFIFMIQKERQYQNLISDYNNYLNWKNNRNPKRAELEAKVAYDAKHAQNLIRILRTGKECLETGKMKVKRIEDKQELLDIKNCKWSYEKVIEEADKIEKQVNEIYFTSSLPLKPDIEFLDNLCIDLIEKSLKEKEK